MKDFFSFVIIILSILLGLYVGIWLMLIGGIVQVINSINPVNAMGIAIGICRIIFCEIAGLIPMLGITIASVLDD